MSVIFGLAKYGNAVSGLELQTVTYGETGSTAEALGEDGYITQMNIHSKKRTFQCEGNVVEGGSLAALTIGGTLTVDSIVYTIESVSIKESANGYKTCSLTGSSPMSAPAGE